MGGKAFWTGRELEAWVRVLGEVQKSQTLASHIESCVQLPVHVVNTGMGTWWWTRRQGGQFLKRSKPLLSPTRAQALSP